MYGRQRIVFYIIMALMLIGLLSNLRAFIIPVIVFGVVFLLYKFPPTSLRGKFRSFKAPGGNRNSRGPIDLNHTKPKRKKYPFTVIQGNKKDDDDDTPTYH
ncbi:hypothetical protein [Paenibacillus gansuensis]|uniref:Uncharacterized protein n=1 Tax=Paenibacillus gansuensis TaxID=306542 RepID=A0ABW5P9R5_9BACL